MSDKIISEELHDGQVVRLTLNSPKGNVLDGEMMGQLQSQFDNLAEKNGVKLIQFTGTGDHFSFGASVEEHTKENAPEMLANFHKLFYSLSDLAIPTMAMVSGQCLGGGLELALMCNFIFADGSAKFGQPEISLGVFAPPASLILPMKIGQVKADELLLTGRIISAEKALAYGLINECYESKEAMSEAVEAWVAKYILPKSGAALRHAVTAARWDFNRTLRKRLKQLEQFYTEKLMATHDANEGIDSFLKRRQPVWEDK